MYFRYQMWHIHTYDMFAYDCVCYTSFSRAQSWQLSEPALRRIAKSMIAYYSLLEVSHIFDHSASEASKSFQRFILLFCFRLVYHCSIFGRDTNRRVWLCCWLRWATRKRTCPASYLLRSHIPPTSRLQLRPKFVVSFWSWRWSSNWNWNWTRTELPELWVFLQCQCAPIDVLSLGRQVFRIADRYGAIVVLAVRANPSVWRGNQLVDDCALHIAFPVAV